MSPSLCCLTCLVALRQATAHFPQWVRGVGGRHLPAKPFPHRCVSHSLRSVTCLTEVTFAEAPGTYRARTWQVDCLTHLFALYIRSFLLKTLIERVLGGCKYQRMCRDRKVFFKCLPLPKCMSSLAENGEGHNIHSEKLSCGKHCSQSPLAQSGRHQRERNEGKDVVNEVMVGTR